MKTLLVFIMAYGLWLISYSQNLIKNAGFEKHYGPCSPSSQLYIIPSQSFDSLAAQGVCTITDWIALSQTPDVYSYLSYGGGGFQQMGSINILTHILIPLTLVLFHFLKQSGKMGIGN